MKLRNDQVFSSTWGAAFMKLCRLNDMDATTKFKLVKLRKQVVDMIEVLKESLNGLSDDQRERLLREYNEYSFDAIGDNEKVVDQLNADELYLLEPLFKEDL